MTDQTQATQEMEAPGFAMVALTSEGSGTGVGSGASTTTTTVVVAGGAPAAPQDNVANATGGAFGANNVSMEGGIDGVVSNPFAAKAVIQVDVEPNLRKDLCLETNFCGAGMIMPFGTMSLFVKLPDCLGCGCTLMSCLASGACTIKGLQKPTCCQGVCGFTIIDFSKIMKCGENDDTLCTCCSCEEQATILCLLQIAYKCEYGIMKTCIKNWAWVFCCDGRCACPCSSFSPCQALCCGYGYRPYVKLLNNGESTCGFRLRNDTNDGSVMSMTGPAQPAPAATTVVTTTVHSG